MHRCCRASSTHFLFFEKSQNFHFCASLLVKSLWICYSHRPWHHNRLKEKKVMQPSTRPPVPICFTFYPNFSYMLHMCCQQRDLLHGEGSYAEASKTCSMSKGKRGGGVNCCDPVKLSIFVLTLLNGNSWKCGVETPARRAWGSAKKTTTWKQVSGDTSWRKKKRTN